MASVYGRQPYHLHVSIVLKSGNLNFLETSGPVQGMFFIPSIISLLDSVTFWSRKVFVGKILYLVFRHVYKIVKSDC